MPASSSTWLSVPYKTDTAGRPRSFCTRRAEGFYHCVLLVLALYSPKSHKLTFLRSHAERLAPQLIALWPRDTRFAKRCFTRLDRAYVGARYSPAYEITGEELTWLVDRVTALQEAVAPICAGRLDGPGADAPGLCYWRPSGSLRH